MIYITCKLHVVILELYRYAQLGISKKTWELWFFWFRSGHHLSTVADVEPLCPWHLSGPGFWRVPSGDASMAIVRLVVALLPSGLSRNPQKRISLNPLRGYNFVANVFFQKETSYFLVKIAVLAKIVN